jgi:lipopolysaccharide transport system permease protein
MLFSDTIVRNCSVIADNAPLITKTIIPAEILPIAITISNLIHHLIGLGILIGAMAALYGLHLSAFWIVLYMAMLLLLAQGLGWIVAGLHVFLRDTIQVLQIVMLLWFFFTPILYTMDRVPKGFRLYAQLNPMAVIVTGYRSSLLDLAQPAREQVALVLAASAAVFVAGGVFFRRAKPVFPDVL